MIFLDRRNRQNRGFLILSHYYQKRIYIKNKKNIYKESFLPGSVGPLDQTPQKCMAEKEIVQAILKYLKTVPQCFAWKEHGGMYGTAGIPDIIACIGGKFYAFEVKVPSGKLTKLQEIMIRRINDANGKACKVTSVQEVKKILENLED